MLDKIKCHICDIIVTFKAKKTKQRFLRKYGGICEDCRNQDKLRNPIIIVNRLLRKGNLKSLSSFEAFELYTSNILNFVHRKKPLVQELRKILSKKFE